MYVTTGQMEIPPVRGRGISIVPCHSSRSANSEPWLCTKTVMQNEVVDFIEELHRRHPDLAKALLESRWISYRADETEQLGIASLVRIAGTDLATAQRILTFPWLADGILVHERLRLEKIAAINDPAQIRLAASMVKMGSPHSATSFPEEPSRRGLAPQLQQATP